MKTAILKTFGFMMTILTVSQFVHTGKAHAATLEMSAQRNSPFTTNTHGGGCGCASCMAPTESTALDNPA